MRRSALFCVFVSLTAVGCRHAPVDHLKDLGPAQLPAGWTLAQYAPAGVSMGLPPGWQEGVQKTIDQQSLTSMATGNGDASALNPGDSTNQMNDGTDPNSPMARIENEAAQRDALEEAKAMDALRAKGTLLHAINPSIKQLPGEIQTAFYLKKIAQDQDVSLEDAAEDERQSLKNGAKATPVTLPIGKAMRVANDFDNRIGDHETHISYVLADGKTTYVLRFAASNNPQAIQQIDQAVAQTLRIKPGKD